MWPATVTRVVRSRGGIPARDDLLGEAVDEVRAVDVPADVETDEGHAATRLDCDDLPKEDRRVLRERVARLGTDGHAERSEVAGHDVGVGGQVDPRFIGTGSDAETTADVDLADRVPGATGPGDGLDRCGQRALEPGEPAGEPARSGMEVDGVDGEVVACRRGQGLVEPLELDAELRRPVAAVLEVGRVAGAAAGVDADPDPAPRRTPSVSLDLADRVEVEMDPVLEEDIEVTVRDVRPGVADLARLPSALEGTKHLTG